jgi:hypothetical protein
MVIIVKLTKNDMSNVCYFHDFLTIAVPQFLSGKGLTNVAQHNEMV